MIVIKVLMYITDTSIYQLHQEWSIQFHGAKTPPPSEGTDDCDTPLAAPNRERRCMVSQLHGFPKLVGFESCILLSSFLELAFWLEQLRQSCFVVFSFHLWHWSSRCGPATRIGMSDGLGYLWRIEE